MLITKTVHMFITYFSIFVYLMMIMYLAHADSHVTPTYKIIKPGIKLPIQAKSGFQTFKDKKLNSFNLK